MARARQFWGRMRGVVKAAKSSPDLILVKRQNHANSRSGLASIRLCRKVPLRIVASKSKLPVEKESDHVWSIGELVGVLDE